MHERFKSFRTVLKIMSFSFLADCNKKKKKFEI